MRWVSTLFLLLVTVTECTEIRCYAGLKYVVGQDVYQDTEDCDSFLGFIGESYCYTFVEETSLNQAVKLGCSNLFCNGVGNRCIEADHFGMQGTLCCCNDRHYCNSSRQFYNVYFIAALLFISACVEILVLLP